jgi:hypothetical protein
MDLILREIWYLAGRRHVHASSIWEWNIHLDTTEPKTQKNGKNVKKITQQAPSTFEQFNLMLLR